MLKGIRNWIWWRKGEKVNSHIEIKIKIAEGMFKADQKKNLENKIEIKSKGKICSVHRIANPIEIVIR